MKTIKGPAIFLAQFIGEAEPYNNLPGLAKWASGLGYKGVQLPSWADHIFDVDKAAESKNYCDEIKGILSQNNLELTEIASHLTGQLVAVHPAYNELFDNFAHDSVKGNSSARQEWAVNKMMNVAKASNNLGLDAAGTFSGALAWPFIYPFPQRPAGLVEEAFDELAKRWMPILNEFENNGIDLCYEIHPSEDLHDGSSFEMFLERVNKHSRCNMLYDPSHYVLQHLNYLDHIDIYHERIKMFHVKDAELNPTGKQGVYGGFQSWVDRAGRFRSLGDGQVDFKSIFSKLSAHDYDGWAVLEWECCIKSPEQGAAEGAPFIQNHIIEVTEKAFDDFADSGIDKDTNKKILGLK
jgi:sugar phosphate isomerase/epimerase